MARFFVKRTGGHFYILCSGRKVPSKLLPRAGFSLTALRSLIYNMFIQ